MKYLHLSVFEGHAKRHGGTRRSEQLRELLEDNDVVEGVTINPYLSFSAAFTLSLRHPITFGRALLFSAKLYFTRGLSLRGFLQYAVCSTNIMRTLESHDFDLVLHETAPGISIPFMQYLAAHKFNYVAIPHNIEYLVPGQVMKIFRANHRAYQVEIEGYRAAHQVLAICNFDAAILRCSGINVRTLEYRPIHSDRSRLQNIREHRAARIHFDGFLIMGTVENTPTFNGVKSLLEKLCNTHSKVRLTVVGYGTEAFKRYQSDTVTVLGSVSESNIDTLLEGTSALLINQPQTTGFLTKIVEMNLCGVPQVVISDYFQAEDMSRYGIIKSQLDSLHEINIPNDFELLPEISIDNPLTFFFPVRST